MTLLETECQCCFHTDCEKRRQQIWFFLAQTRKALRSTSCFLDTRPINETFCFFRKVWVWPNYFSMIKESDGWFPIWLDLSRIIRFFKRGMEPVIRQVLLRNQSWIIQIKKKINGCVDFSSNALLLCFIQTWIWGLISRHQITMDYPRSSEARVMEKNLIFLYLGSGYILVRIARSTWINKRVKQRFCRNKKRPNDSCMGAFGWHADLLAPIILNMYLGTLCSIKGGLSVLSLNSLPVAFSIPPHGS